MEKLKQLKQLKDNGLLDEDEVSSPFRLCTF
jgi:hypothetical protein